MELPEEVVQRLGAMGVAAVWLFGSRVSGRPRPDSDTDVAVLLGEDARLSLLDRGRITDLLAGPLDAETVDLVVLDEAPLELRAAVLYDGREIARIDAARRVTFEVETVSRWVDVREAIRHQDRAYLARVAREGLG